MSARPTTKQAYTTNGVTTVFTLPFVFDTSADLRVYYINNLQQAVIKELTVDYTVSGGGGSGGAVTFGSAPAAGGFVVIVRLGPPEIDYYDFTNTQDSDHDVAQAALDRVDVGATYQSSSGAGATYVPLTRTVNSHALSTNIALTTADIGEVTNLYFTDERAQDAIGAMVDSTIVYVDATPLLTRGALTGAITAAQASNATLLGSFTKAQLDGAVSDGNVVYVGDITALSGTYTPTLTNVANLDASTAYAAQYMRVGSVVTVSGKVDVDPTAPGSTQLGVSLPIASNLAAAEQCAGTAFASGIAGQGAAIRGDATNDRAEMIWVAVDLTNQSMFYTFTYQVI